MRALPRCEGQIAKPALPALDSEAQSALVQNRPGSAVRPPPQSTRRRPGAVISQQRPNPPPETIETRKEPKRWPYSCLRAVHTITVTISTPNRANRYAIPSTKINAEAGEKIPLKRRA